MFECKSHKLLVVYSFSLFLHIFFQVVSTELHIYLQGTESVTLGNNRGTGEETPKQSLEGWFSYWTIFHRLCDVQQKKNKKKTRNSYIAVSHRLCILSFGLWTVNYDFRLSLSLALKAIEQMCLQELEINISTQNCATLKSTIHIYYRKIFG